VNKLFLDRMTACQYKIGYCKCHILRTGISYFAAFKHL